MHKPVQIKALSETGEVEAVIATFNVIDADGDVTLPGFFGTQDVKMVWHHEWADWLGKGTVTEEPKVAVFNGNFFMGIPSVEEQHAKVKAMDDLAEWSYGFRTHRGGRVPGTHDDQDVTFLGPLPDGSPGAKIYEVSPVLAGAGVGTHTRHIKGLDGPGGAVKFLDQITDVLEGVEAVRGRAGEIIDLRKADGKTLGVESLDSLAGLAAEVKELAEVMALMVEPSPATEILDMIELAAKAKARFVSLTAAAR